MKRHQKLAVAAIMSCATVGGIGFSSAVSAQDCTFSTPAAGSEDCSNEVEAKPITPTGPVTPSNPNVQPQTTQPTQTTQTNLPVTGGETATLAAAGAALVAGGVLMVRRSRSAAPRA